MNQSKPIPLYLQHRSLYWAWSSMRGRCENINNPNYKDWGGRGIKVCDRWQSFENFLADMGDRPKGKLLDRKNNNEGYSLQNCRWVTYEEQNRNRRSTRITYAIALEIAKKMLNGASQLAVSKEYGVCKSLPGEIRSGRKWKDACEEAKRWRTMADNAKEQREGK